MALVFKQFINFYKNNSDPRVDDWFLVSTPMPCVTTVVLYLGFVLYLGPLLMKNRRPFTLEKAMQLFNISQIALNMYLVIVGYDTVVNRYKWGCAEVTKDDHGLFVANMVYLYHIIKIMDLLDTVFFVLRKKQNQITFLHVYHHFGMVVLTFFGTKFVPGGHSIFMGYINCIVHVFMYVYYFLTSYNSEFKKNIWLKRRITELQLFQFFIFLVWYTQILFRSSCGYPKFVSFVFVPQNLFMFVLFGDFYIKAYLKPQKKKKAIVEKLQIVEEPRKDITEDSWTEKVEKLKAT